MLTFWVISSLLGVLAVWFAASWCNYVRSDEVALRRFFGRLEKKLRESGLVFVELFPGVDLVRIPKKMFRLSYEGTTEHKIYTKDNQLAFPEVTFFLEFPYKKEEIDSLVKLIEKDIPLTEEGLTVWAEDILIPALRQAFSKKDHTELVGDIDLVDINNTVNEILHKDGSVLRECGIMGSNYKETSSGTGRAFAEVEAVGLPDELQKAMQRPVVARYNANAARETARMNAEEIGGQILGIVARKHAMTIEVLEADLKAHPEKVGKSIKRGGYAETFEWAQAQTTRDRAGDVSLTYDDRKIDINSGGKAITDPNFAGIAAIIGGVTAAVSQLKGGGRGKQGNRGGGSTDGSKSKELTQGEEDELKKRLGQ